MYINEKEALFYHAVQRGDITLRNLTMMSETYVYQCKINTIFYKTFNPLDSSRNKNN